MLTRKETRAQACATLKGKWTQPVLVTLIYLAIVIVYELFTNTQVTSTGFSLLMEAVIYLAVLFNLDYGYMVSFLRLSRGNEKTVSEVFNAGFKPYGRVWILQFLTALYTLLWGLLLIIPGIIKGYAYSMAPFICEDHPEFTENECIDKSKEMMNGHKWDLFLLDLSFIGWYLLGIVSLGIGFLWVLPYHYSARVKFYEQLVAGQNEVKE